MENVFVKMDTQALLANLKLVQTPAQIMVNALKVNVNAKLVSKALTVLYQFVRMNALTGEYAQDHLNTNVAAIMDLLV